MALQPPGFQQGQAAAKIPPGKPGDKNSKNRLTSHITLMNIPALYPNRPPEGGPAGLKPSGQPFRSELDARAG